MWKRFQRLIASIFGGAIAAMEDPKLILEQNIRELNDQVPKMNENIATVKANVILLQKEVAGADREAAELTAKIRAAITASRDDIAQGFAMRLEQVRSRKVASEEQLRYAEQAYEKALQIKKAFMRERERKINEANEALRAHERAKWQARVADALEGFEVAGVDQTHREMIQRVNEQAAKNEARMEMALDSVDTQSMKIEEDAEAIRAQELVNQMKMEMGLAEPAPQTRTSSRVSLPEGAGPDDATGGAGARTRTE
jgi:phage shock protein A